MNMIEQWQELKETIVEMRDNDGTGTQQEVCKFLATYMDNLEKQMQEPCDDVISREDFIAKVKDIYYGYMLDNEGCCPQDFVDLAEEMPSVRIRK